ncbi:MAG: hypothetical protein WCG25_05160 [bacterium]
MNHAISINCHADNFILSSKSNHSKLSYLDFRLINSSLLITGFLKKLPAVHMIFQSGNLLALISLIISAICFTLRFTILIFHSSIFLFISL